MRRQHLLSKITFAETAVKSSKKSKYSYKQTLT